MLACVFESNGKKGALPDKAYRIVCEWWEGVKNCMHAIRENLYSRHQSNTNIGKQSEHYCNEICKEKGTNWQKDTCMLNSKIMEIGELTSLFRVTLH